MRMDKKQTTPIAKTARLLNLVPYLLAHQNISLADLSAEFDVTEKEMLEDLNTLWMCGLPGYTPLELIDLSFDSGFVTISNAEVLQEVRSLTSEEIIVLILGLDLILSAVSSGDTETRNAIEALRLKAQHIIGDVVRVKPAVPLEIYNLIDIALKQRRELHFTYLTAIKDGESDRTIRPTDLRTEGSSFYLDGYSLDARGFRTFRIDRISNLRIGETFDSSAQVEVGPDKSLGQVQLRKNHRKASERFGLALEASGSAIAATQEFSYFSSEWVVRTVMETGGDVELLRPSNVRGEVLSRAQSLLSAYERGDLPQ